MGRKQQWDSDWNSGAWQRQPASSSAWAPKGYGKYKGKHPQREQPGRYKDKWENAETDQQQFPSFEMMRPKPRTTKASGVDDAMDIEEMPSTGMYVNGVQRIVNGLRKAESKQRKLEAETEELEAKWEQFQAGLKESYLKERAKYREKSTKLAADIAEQQQAKEAILVELQKVFAEPAILQKPKPAAQEDPEAVEELAKLLTTPAARENRGLADIIGALQGGGGDLTRQQLLAAIDAQRGPPRTPPRRHHESRAMTPPAVAARKAEPEPTAHAKTADEMDGMGPDRPYPSSPSLTGLLPSPGGAERSRSRSSTRTPIKYTRRKPTRVAQHHGIKDKLELIRQKGQEALAETIEDSEEDVTIDEPKGGGGTNGDPEGTADVE